VVGKRQVKRHEQDAKDGGRHKTGSTLTHAQIFGVRKVELFALGYFER